MLFTQKVLSIRLLFRIIKSPNKNTEKRGDYTPMRDRNQVVIPINLGICIPEGDFVVKVAEICEKLDYTKLWETYVRAWRKVNRSPCSRCLYLHTCVAYILLLSYSFLPLFAPFRSFFFCSPR